MIFRQFYLEFRGVFLSLLRESSSTLCRISLSEDETMLEKLANTEERVLLSIRMFSGHAVVFECGGVYLHQ